MKVVKKPSVGVVKRKVAKVGHHPVITRKPHGSRERKVIEQVTGNKRFWEKAKEKYFR